MVHEDFKAWPATAADSTHVDSLVSSQDSVDAQAFAGGHYAWAPLTSNQQVMNSQCDTFKMPSMYSIMITYD